MTEFFFYGEGIYELAEKMQPVDEIAIYNGLRALIPALWLYLKRFDYHCRYGDKRRVVYGSSRKAEESKSISKT